VPEDLGSLSRQRRPWHRGLGQTLWRHRRAVGNPRLGAFGLVALPYFVVFEFLGPVIETFGAALTVVAFLVGIVLSIAARVLEEFNFRRQQRARDVVAMVLYSVLENFGYRQLNDVWRVLALVDLARNKQGWGAQSPARDRQPRRRRRMTRVDDTPTRRRGAGRGASCTKEDPKTPRAGVPGGCGVSCTRPGSVGNAPPRSRVPGCGAWSTVEVDDTPMASRAVGCGALSTQLARDGDGPLGIRASPDGPAATHPADARRNRHRCLARLGIRPRPTAGRPRSPPVDAERSEAPEHRQR
jgi:hypothetical protein